MRMVSKKEKKLGEAMLMNDGWGMGDCGKKLCTLALARVI